MTKLELRDVSFSYSVGTPMEKHALSGVNVAFEAGKVTGVIGHTGSGKSTLVTLLNGLYKPTSGTVLLDGEDIWAKPREIGKIRFRVGLVMQYPEYQLFDETVRSDIGFAPRNLGLSDEEVALRVKEAASFVGLSEEMLDRSPFELSGGQKRRVAIAGILAMRPEVLVLDEPAAGLDPRGRREILGGLTGYAKEHGTTLIFISHSMEDMAAYCDNLVILSQGKVVRCGTTREIFSGDLDLSAIGLSYPEVSEIAKRLIAAGIPLVGELYTVGGVKDAILRYQRGCGE